MLKVIKVSIIFLLTLFLFVYFSLLSGIKISSFSLANFSFSQLYLKLDKKLILEIEEIELSLKESRVKSSKDDILKSISNLEFFLKIFKRIDIERFKVKDNEFTITINEKYLYLDNKYLNVSADLDVNTNQIFLNIYSIYLKDIDLTLIGKSKIDFRKKILNFFGEFQLDYVEGEINAQLNEQYFDFYVDTKKPIKSLKFLKKFFRLGKTAEAWMYDNVTGDIDLKYLYGKIDLIKKEPIIESIKGQATITDAKIKFHENAQVIDTKKLMVTYENDKLVFDLENPSYNQNKIYGSRVYINDLTSKEGVVVVDLKTKSMLNSDILEILDAYKIKLPLRQLSGELDSTLLLKIPYLASKKMEIDGLFKAKNALLKLKNFKFLAKNAEIVLKDNDVIIKNSHMLYNDMLDANLDLTIDTKNLVAKGNAKINNFEIKGDSESIVKITNFEVPLDIDFNNTTKVDLKTLKTKFEIKDEYIDIKVADLALIYPYSKLLETIDIKNGDLEVKLYNENLIEFDVNANDLNFPFEKDGKPIKSLSAKGIIKDKLTKITTNSSDIEIVMREKKNTILRLKNIDLALNKGSDENRSKKFPNIDLELENSIIKFNNKYFYKTKWADVNIRNSKILFKGEVVELDLPILKDDKEVKNLELFGKYENNILDIETKDKKLKFQYDITKDKILMNLENYDILYDTKQESNEDSKISFYINGINSNIIINEKHLTKATKYKFVFERDKTDIDLQYKTTSFKFNKDFAGHITINAKNMNDDFLNSLFSKQLIKDGEVDLYAVGKEGVINGNAFIENSRIMDLAILNNLITLINTSPGLINPFLVIPSVVGMATNDGFNLNGYRIVEGKVDFNYDFNKKFLNMHKINTKGNGIDFDGYTTIDFNNSNVDAKLKLIFFKDYSKIVGSIPVINYVLLGDKKRVDTEVIIYGTLEQPKYRTKLLEEGVSAPINVIKRIFTSPLELFKPTNK